MEFSADLGSVEGVVIDCLERHKGKCNRAAMLGAYNARTVYDDKRAYHGMEVADALNTLAEKGLITINASLEVVLEKDEYEIYNELSENTEQYKKLIQAAIETQKNSWSPYSNFKVGAAILTTQGDIITGTNFENASYGVTICAERGAIGAAVKDGKLNPQQGKFIKAIAAVLPVEDLGKPCGACRQAIYEFSRPGGEAYVVMATPSGKAEVKKIKDMLPYAFGPFDLGVIVEEN